MMAVAAEMLLSCGNDYRWYHYFLALSHLYDGSITCLRALCVCTTEKEV